MFYKIYQSKSPFSFKLILQKTSSYVRRNVDGIPLIKIKHNFFRNTFFPTVAFSKAISSNLLDPPQDVFSTITANTTTKAFDK